MIAAICRGPPIAITPTRWASALAFFNSCVSAWNLTGTGTPKKCTTPESPWSLAQRRGSPVMLTAVSVPPWCGKTIPATTTFRRPVSGPSGTGMFDGVGAAVGELPCSQLAGSAFGDQPRGLNRASLTWEGAMVHSFCACSAIAATLPWGAGGQMLVLTIWTKSPAAVPSPSHR